MALDVKSDKVGYILFVDNAFHICTRASINREVQSESEQ